MVLANGPEPTTPRTIPARTGAAARIHVKDGHICFYCPGCKCAHCIPITGPRAWNWNGDVENPTITPSLRIFSPAIPDTAEYKGLPERTHCHVVVTNGQLNFCGDSAHELKGTSVPCPEWRE